MAEDWAAIAAEIGAAIADVGFTATLEKPGVLSGDAWDQTPGPPTLATISVIDDQVRVRDAAGSLAAQSVRMLTVAATGVAPAKDDRVQVRGTWHQIRQVMPLAPGGVDLLFEVELH